MTRSIMGSRRPLALLLGAATATTLLVSGCGAGQIAETAVKEPSVYGVNVQTADNSFKVRGLAVSYLNPGGYPAGGDAPLEVLLYNDSNDPMTVRVTSEGARAVVLVGGPAAPQSPDTTGAPDGSNPTAGAGPETEASPSTGQSPAGPSPTATPAATDPAATPAAPGSPDPATSPTAAPQPPAGGSASLEIPARSYLVLNPSSGSFLRLTGLNGPLAPGQSVGLTFEVNGVRLPAQAPVAIPLSPAPVATPLHEDEEGGHG